ncbi:MAG TPA: hypothetical protein VGI45_34700 [Terracidiphilus sp.]|jgi:uncharacterized membrane protein YphA (DoxX/SURF4 family)
MKVGIYALGLASIAAGILDLVWGEFESAHQPIQAWGDHIPGVTFFAYVTAIWLIAGGAAILFERTARIGAVMLAIVYTAFAVFWLPRFYTAPHYRGYRLSVYIGVLGGPGGQLIVTIGALMVYAVRSGRVLSEWQATAARWVFGLFVADFGVVHLIDIPEPAAMVPAWMPAGGAFWAWVSGIAFILAGLGIVSGVLDVLAARLLALMFLLFSILVLTPLTIASPHEHTSWGGNAYNLAAFGATLIFADWLATERRTRSLQAGGRRFGIPLAAATPSGRNCPR